MAAGRVAGGLALVVVAWTLVACSEPAPEAVLRLDVRTDLVPGLEFDVVFAELEGAPGQFREVASSEDWATGVRVGTWTLSGDARLQVRAEFRGNTVVSRVAVTRVEGSTGVVVTLTRSCRGVPCPGAGDPSAEACLGGRCVRAECLSGAEAACGELDCRDDSDCEGAGVESCARPRCAQGVCLLLDEGICGEGTRCLPEAGCVAVSMDVDAGLADAGLADAGLADAGLADAGLADAGLADAGRADAGANESPWAWENDIRLGENGDVGDRHGQALALSRDGTLLVAGAPGDDRGAVVDPSDDSVRESGAVRVYEWNGADWNLLAFLKAPSPAPDDAFGSAVAMSEDGDWLVAGAPAEDAPTATGAVHVFRREAATWVHDVALAGEAPGDRFGYSVALDRSGAYLLVGAPGPEASGRREGRVYLYRRDASTWVPQALPSPGGLELGYAVALDALGLRLAVSARWDGVATVFVRSGDIWTEEQRIEIEGSSRLGEVLAFDEGGDVLVATDGSWDVGETNDNVGATHVLRRSGARWTREATLTAFNADENDRMGQSIALNAAGTRLAVGVDTEDSRPGDPSDNTLDGAGAVYTFRLGGDGWVAEGMVPKAIDTESGERMGASVAMPADGSVLVVGAPGRDGRIHRYVR